MIQRIGQRTLAFEKKPCIRGHAAVVGRKEGEGPLGNSFDLVSQDAHFGQKTWELAEAELQKQTIALAVQKAELQLRDLDLLLAGDLLNQCISSAYAARGQDIPYFGLYGACSTMGESLALAAMTLDGGFGTCAGAVASSHFCSAERQYRTPLEYGGQRTPTAQWTVTGAGAAILSSEGPGPYITHVTIGKIVDKGITDANNMGAAMAPANVRIDPCPKILDMTALHNKNNTALFTASGWCCFFHSESSSLFTRQTKHSFEFWG